MFYKIFSVFWSAAIYMISASKSLSYKIYLHEYEMFISLMQSPILLLMFVPVIFCILQIYEIIFIPIIEILGMNEIIEVIFAVI